MTDMYWVFALSTPFIALYLIMEIIIDKPSLGDISFAVIFILGGMYSIHRLIELHKMEKYLKNEIEWVK